VLAPTADRVLLAVDEVVVAGLVTAEPVTGVQPTVAPELVRALGHVPVRDRGPPRLVGAHDELTDLSDGHLVVVLVDDANLVAGPGSATRRRVVGDVAPARDVAGLGHAVVRAHGDAEALAELVDDRREDGVAQ